MRVAFEFTPAACHFRLESVKDVSWHQDDFNMFILDGTVVKKVLACQNVCNKFAEPNAAASLIKI